MKMTLGVIVVAVIVGTAGTWYWNSTSSAAPDLRTLPAERGELLISVSATGTVEPVEIVDVGAQIIGRIKSFGADPEREGETVDYGSRVKEGDVLAQIDDEPYHVEMETAEAALLLAEAEVKRQEAKLTQAKQEFDRAKELRGTNSASDYDRAFAGHEIAKAEVAVAEARREQAKIAKKAVQIKLSYTTIRSPIDGVVIDRRVDEGQTVVAGLNAPSLFLLARDLSRMQVLAAVNEADIGDIQKGQDVVFKVDAYRGQQFTGKVSQIRLNASSLNNVVTYDVVVDIDNTDGKLLPYMTANLQFVVSHRSDALLVPNQALRWRPSPNQVTPSAREKFKVTLDGKGREKVEVDSPTVWVVANDGLARPVDVSLGMSDGMVTEISGGELEPGTNIVVNAKSEAQKDFVSSFVSRVTN